MNKNHLTPIDSYYAALKRLVKNNKRISFDAVALEAGRGRGAIKGNSYEIQELKKVILREKSKQDSNIKVNSSKHKLSKTIEIKENYKMKYEDLLKINDKLLNDLCNAVYELAELKSELNLILDKKNNIINFNEKS